MGDPWRPEIPPEVRARLDAVEKDPNDPYQRSMAERDQQAKVGPGAFDQLIDIIKTGLQVLTQGKPEKENYNIPDPRPKDIDTATKRATGNDPDPWRNIPQKTYTQKSNKKY